jgi:hypothetical protein
MLMSVAAGCAGDQEPGTPSPAVTSGTAGSTSAPASSARPATLPLDQVRLCELFTDDIRREFGLQGSPRMDSGNQGQPSCLMQGAPPSGFIISAATAEGMERFDGIPEQLATVRRMTVAGFPAAELRDKHQPNACLIGVDVADGQHLEVYLNDVPKGGTQDEICQNAAKFAEAVVASLRQQLGR